MDIETIFDRFSVLCGLDSEEAEKYRFLCRDAAAALESAALNDAVVGENQAAFCAAAAAYAAYCCSLTVGRGLKEVTGFRAGDVTLSLSSGGKKSGAGEYLIKCIESIKPFLKDSDFSFEAV